MFFPDSRIGAQCNFKKNLVMKVFLMYFFPYTDSISVFVSMHCVLMNCLE